MLSTTCYPREVLEQYARGQADDELSGAIDAHLESCRRCEDALSHFDTHDDSLIRTLQVKTGDKTVKAPAWVEHLASRPMGVSDQECDSVGHRDNDADARSGRAIPSANELGDYELISVLGRGGMSVVFAARHKHLGRDVALKSCHHRRSNTPSRGSDSRER